MVKEQSPSTVRTRCIKRIVDQCSLWHHCIPVAFAFSLSSIGKSFLFTLPFWSNHWKPSSESFFINKPYGLWITSITILLLGILLHYTNKLNDENSLIHNFIKSFSHIIKQVASIKSHGIMLWKKSPLQPLFITYLIVILLNILFEQFQPYFSDLFKETMYSIELGVIVFTGLLCISIFPPVYACITYALAIVCNITFYECTLYIDPNYIHMFQVIAPFLALPLFIIGIPNLEPHYNITNPKKVSRPTVSISNHSLQYVALSLIGLLSTFQFFLNAATIDTFIFINAYLSETYSATIFMLSSQLIAAIFAIWIIKSKDNAHLMLLLFILGLLGISTILYSILIQKTVPIVILQLASGLITMFCIITFSILVHSQKCMYKILAISIFVMNIVGYFSGYALWNIAIFLKNSSSSIIHIHIPILGIVSVLSILLIQSLYYHIMDISHLCYILSSHDNSMDAYVYQDKLNTLTPREKEILSLVQQGLKNIEISNRLSITEGTLRVHLRNTYRKLNIQGRQSLKSLPHNL